MMKRLILIVLVLLAATGAAGWWWLAHGAAAAAGGAAAGTAADGASSTAAATTPAQAGGGGGRRGGGGPATVLVATAAAADLPVARNAIGTVAPLASVTVRTQLSGKLDQVLFSEGQLVKQGDLLAQIDARQYVLAEQQYGGQLQRDQAQLDQALADLARYTKLAAEDSLPRQQLDAQTALVAQLRGTVAADQAQIETARLDQSYCRITAPIAGRLGLRQVDQGNYVTPGDAAGLVVITQVAPISVTFTLPETDLPLVVGRIRGGEQLAITVLDRDGSSKLASGTVTTLDNAIDATTGTVRLRAQVANEDERLFPNQFVNVRLLIERRHVAVAVPAAAVQHGPQGAYVWVVSEGKAVLKVVQTGLQAGERIELSDGVAVGDQVVVDGVDRLKDGAPVNASDAPAGQGRKWGGNKDASKEGSKDGSKEGANKAGGDAGAGQGEHKKHRQSADGAAPAPADGAAAPAGH